ncbi:c-type cytochrome [Phaeovulum sp.]|uniref:c-type cytochrome n=1 Tax=Phaeovulum sp. TaxID=2934796 RepID=UPI0039E6AEEC
MKISAKALTLGLICAAGIAYAKEGVQNPIVKTRMDTMDVIRANTAILGDMAGDKAPFDEAKATEAAAALSAAATTIPQVFEPEETDPVSEALPDIWNKPDEFGVKAETLYKAAQSIDTASLDGVRAGMGAIGGACKSCHESFRMKKE